MHMHEWVEVRDTGRGDAGLRARCCLVGGRSPATP
jgi:hypothetical protein